MSEDDQAQILAYEGTVADMRAYEDMLDERERIRRAAEANIKAKTGRR